MKSFKNFIKESVSVEKVIHFEHLEDLPIIQGRSGLDHSLSILTAIASKLVKKETSEISVKMKFDGSPSLIVGINPENNKFFVGTKSVFNKLHPKLNYTEEDIDINHTSSELRNKLKYALKYLKELNIRGILQGDLMFVPGDIKNKNVDGVDSLTFRPNTITYVVKKESELGKKIDKAKIGIIFHTKYTGTHIKNLKANFDLDISLLKNTPDVWFEDSSFQMESDKDKKLSSTEIKNISKKLKELKFSIDTIDKSLLDKIELDNQFKNVILQFINYLVRIKNNDATPKEKVSSFIKYLDAKTEGELSLKKTENGKNRTIKRKQYILDVVKHNLKSFILLFSIHRLISDIKIELMKLIGRKDDLKNYIDIDNKLFKTDPEGFIVISDSYGTTKLVNRNEFSRYNFNLEKNWKK